MPTIIRRNGTEPASRATANTVLKKQLSPLAVGGIAVGLAAGLALLGLGHRTLTTPAAPPPREMPQVVQGEDVAAPATPQPIVEEDPYVTEQRMNAINQAIMKQQGE